MYNQEMYRLGSKRSTIREIFEYAKKRSAEIGADKVFDFSIGNPSVPAPKERCHCAYRAGNAVRGIARLYVGARG